MIYQTGPSIFPQKDIFVPYVLPQKAIPKKKLPVVPIKAGPFYRYLQIFGVLLTGAVENRSQESPENGEDSV